MRVEVLDGDLLDDVDQRLPKSLTIGQEETCRAAVMREG